MTSADVTYERYEGAMAAERLDSFLPAYEEIYREPPYSEGPSDIAQFIEHYVVHTRRPGMRLVLATNAGEVIGFTYGFLLPSDTGWWTNLDRSLPEEWTRETGARTWAVIELAVRKQWRRRGIAAALHAALLDELKVERVTLTVRPEPSAAPAQSAYQAWGYRSVGTVQPWEGAPVYTAMVLALAKPATETAVP